MKVTLQVKAVIYVDADLDVKNLQEALFVNANEVLGKALKESLDRIVDWEMPEIVGVVKQGD